MVKALFIPAKIKSEVNEKKIKALKLPKNIAIAYSIQYKEIAAEIRKILSGKHGITGMLQVLGCSKPAFAENTEAVLLIGSGRFHAVSLSYETKLPIYMLESDKLIKISNEEMDSFRKKKLASYMKFLNSEKVGILVSAKPGQERLKKAIELQKKLKKKSYLFLSNETDIGQFGNFPEIKSWINTACPRLDFDSSVVNMNELKNNNQLS